MQLNHEQRMLVESNMGLVGAVLRDHVKNTGNLGIFTQEDLYQIGCMGLCKAAMTNKSGTARFSTYAYICIRNEIFGALEYATLRRQREVSTEDNILALQNRTANTEDGITVSQTVELGEVLEALKEGATVSVVKGIEALQLYAQGYNYREIGEQMGGVPAKNVTAWVSKARKYLKDQPALLRLKEEVI